MRGGIYVSFISKKTVVNEVFGSVQLFADSWSSANVLELILWDKVNRLHVSIVNDVDNGINHTQETVFTQFKNNLGKHQCDIERIVSSYFNIMDTSSLIEKFVPYQLLLNTNGECVIIAENKEDEDIHDVLPGLAVVIYPKLAIFTADTYSRYAFFDLEEDVKKELYGDD